MLDCHVMVHNVLCVTTIMFPFLSNITHNALDRKSVVGHLVHTFTIPDKVHEFTATPYPLLCIAHQYKTTQKFGLVYNYTIHCTLYKHFFLYSANEMFQHFHAPCQYHCDSSSITAPLDTFSDDANAFLESHKCSCLKQAVFLYCCPNCPTGPANLRVKKSCAWETHWHCVSFLLSRLPKLPGPIE